MNGVLCVSLHRKLGSLSIFDSTISSAPLARVQPLSVCSLSLSFFLSSLFRRVSIIVRYIPRKSLSVRLRPWQPQKRERRGGRTPIDWIVSARTKSPPPSTSDQRRRERERDTEKGTERTTKKEEEGKGKEEEEEGRKTDDNFAINVFELCGGGGGAAPSCDDDRGDDDDDDIANATLSLSV